MAKKKTARQILSDEKKEKAFQLMLSNMEYKDIAVALGVTKRQVQNYINDKRKELAENVKSMTSEQVFGVLSAEQQKRVRGLWAIVSGKDVDVTDKLRAYHLLGVESDRFFRQCQAVGIVPKTEMEAPFVTAKNIENLSIQQNNVKKVFFIRGNPPPEVLKRLEGSN